MFTSKQMLAIVLVVATVVSVVSLALTNIKPVEVIGAVDSSSNLKTITASGKAGIKVAPDIAYINIGVDTEGKELTKVQLDNATKMNSVMKSLMDLGVNKEDIKTLNYSVSPKYEWNDSTRKSVMTGYSINNTLEVTIKDISKVGNIIDKVVANGSNNVNNIRFGVKDETTLYNQALELAVKDAKTKAIAMGKGLDISSMEPVQITESSYRYQPVYAEKNMSMDMVAQNNTQISEGELEITASVVVDFSFK